MSSTLLATQKRIRCHGLTKIDILQNYIYRYTYIYITNRVEITQGKKALRNAIIINLTHQSTIKTLTGSKSGLNLEIFYW